MGWSADSEINAWYAGGPLLLSEQNPRNDERTEKEGAAFRPPKLGPVSSVIAENLVSGTVPETEAIQPVNGWLSTSSVIRLLQLFIYEYQWIPDNHADLRAGFQVPGFHLDTSIL
jgi:hypothetical protein